MPWLLILLAVVALGGAFLTTSMALGIVCLLAALGLLIAGVMGLLADRVGTRSRDETSMIDPQELQRLRQQAEARRNAAGATSANGDAGAP
jgi:ABC-type transport system involved in cytochrome bd biosynthesis fused ATPase/permease subunit